MNKPSIGLQLIIFGRRAGEDFDGVVRDAAEAGYEGIEHGNLFHEASPEEIRYLYGKYGLAVAGMHCGYADLLDEAVVDDNISFLDKRVFPRCLQELVRCTTPIPLYHG